jgi:hypothetical protein
MLRPKRFLFQFDDTHAYFDAFCLLCTGLFCEFRFSGRVRQPQYENGLGRLCGRRLVGRLEGARGVVRGSETV